MNKKLLLPAFMLIGVAASTINVQAQCNELFFSEYLEGSSNNKAIEFYNPTNATVNLSDYKVFRYNNGSPTPTDSLQPVGTLAPGDVYVAGNPSAVASILNVSDTLHTITFFNGDDAMVLKNMTTNTVLDIIGIIGVDPGTNWPVGTGATSEFTLVRSLGIQQGNTNWANAANEYTVYAQNTDTTLGVHYMTSCCTPPSIQLLTQVDPLCFGDSNGTIQINATGNGPMSFSWINLPDTTPYLTNVPAGSYTVVAMGACGSDTLVVTLTEPTQLTQTLTASTLPGCNMANGSLTITASGSVAPYTYMWSNGGITPTISNMPSGMYTCTVTCTNGCTSVNSYSLPSIPPVVTVSLALDTVCAGPLGAPLALNGESPAGGTWSGTGVSGSTFYPDSVPSLGWYVITYTYTDSMNCTGTAIDSVFVDFCSGISLIDNNDFVVSPNPFSNEIRITFATAAWRQVEVIDIHGRVVQTFTTNASQQELNLGELSNGMYVLRVFDGAEYSNIRVQKAN